MVEESLRWTPTDPMFSRFVASDTELGGIAVPTGSVVHVCLAAANRDPARWDDPDSFDPGRPVQSHLGFGNGAHICLGMHVARAEIRAAVRRAASSGFRTSDWIPTPRAADHRDVRAGPRRGARPLRLTPPRRSRPLTPSQRRDGRSPLSPDTSTARPRRRSPSQRPRNRGGRFSAKATVPSHASSLSKTAAALARKVAMSTSRSRAASNAISFARTTRERRVRRDLLGQAERGRQDVDPGDDPVHQPVVQRARPRPSARR